MGLEYSIDEDTNVVELAVNGTSIEVSFQDMDDLVALWLWAKAEREREQAHLLVRQFMVSQAK